MKKFTRIEELLIDIDDQISSEVGKYLINVGYISKVKNNINFDNVHKMHRKIQSKTFGGARRIYRQLLSLEGRTL